MKALFLTIIALVIYSTNAIAQTEENIVATPLIEIIKHRDIQYGRHSKHKLDVYTPENAENAPILFMVHGGAWRWGDKTSKHTVEHKIKKWGQENFIIVSANYRLLPTFPYNQAHDLRHALKYIQNNAEKWGGDPSKIILMGHSAGGHLVALVNSNPNLAENLGVKPWLGAVVLDSAALDVVSLMSDPEHANAYDRAFGSKLYVWNKSSPYHQITKQAPPFFFACSTKREHACPQAEKFVKQAMKMGVEAHISEQDLSHKNMNKYVGGDNEYTAEIDEFVKGLLN